MEKFNDMEKTFNIGRMKAEAMAKAFGVDIEKAAHGIYEDNAENRRLNRVGQEYGHKAEEKQAVGKQPKQGEKTEQEKKTSAATMESAAQGASDGALKRASQDPKAPADVKAAAKKELENREGASEEVSEKDTKDLKRIEKQLKSLERRMKETMAERDADESYTPSEDPEEFNYYDNVIAAQQKEIDRLTKRKENILKKTGGKTGHINGAAGELADILDPVDDWEDDDWNDADKNAELFSQIRSVISKYDMSEDEFRSIAKKYPGLDLVYTDYAPHDKIVPIAKEKIRTELKKFDDFSDDDWNDPSKQDVITNKLTFYVRHYNISEDEWNEIVKPYAEGLSGLPYSDFK